MSKPIFIEAAHHDDIFQFAPNCPVKVKNTGLSTIANVGMDKKKQNMYAIAMNEGVFPETDLEFAPGCPVFWNCKGLNKRRTGTVMKACRRGTYKVKLDSKLPVIIPQSKLRYDPIVAEAPRSEFKMEPARKRQRLEEHQYRLFVIFPTFVEEHEIQGQFDHENNALLWFRSIPGNVPMKFNLFFFYFQAF